MIQTANLNQEVKTVTETIKTLQKTKYTQDAQILQLTGGQFKLAVELNSTQQAINRTMHLVNQHSDTIRGHDEAIRRIGEFQPLLIINSTHLCITSRAISYTPQLKLF